VAVAFSRDDAIIEVCKAVVDARTLLHLINTALPTFCRKKGKNLYFCFDQHNALSAEQRQRFPFSLPELELESLQSLVGVASLIVSASANNEFYLKVVAKNLWPIYSVTNGFAYNEHDAKCEVKVWLKYYNLFHEAPLEQLLYWTNCIPLELALVRDERKKLAETGSQADLDHVLKAYLISRKKMLAVLVEVFHTENKDFEGLLVNAVVAMELGLVYSPASIKCNQQLTVIVDEHVRALTPMASAALVDFYEIAMKKQNR